MNYAKAVKSFIPTEEELHYEKEENTAEYVPSNGEYNHEEFNDTEFNYKNYEEEYDKKYTLQIHDLKFAFRNYVIENGYPFMNGEAFYYTFFDYIKYNSDTYTKIRNEVDSYNQVLEEEEKKELEEIEQEEIEEFEHFNSMSEYYS